jgi:hypothetical protein
MSNLSFSDLSISQRRERIAALLGYRTLGGKHE